MTNWIIFAIASAILIYVGFLTGNKIKRDPDANEGFLLGGRDIGPFIAAGTLMATGYSGWGFIGSPGTAYAYGSIEVLANFFFAPAITFGSLYFAGYMRRKGEEMGGLTIPEYIAVTHKGSEGLKRTVHFVAGITTFIFLSVFMIGQIRATGYVAAEWLDISPLTASIILMSIIVIFTVQGGLLAVAITDTIMCMGMLIAAVIIYFTITRDISMLDLFAEVGKIDPSFTNPETSNPYGDGKYSVFLVFIYALLFTTTLPYMSVRFLAFKENMKTHVMAIYMAPMGIILSLIPLTGLYMKYKMPGLENPDSAMPVFLNTYLHPAIGGMITLFILFAMLSTISSILQALASALSHDMYVSLTKKSTKHETFFNRFAVVLTAVFCLVLTYLAPQGMLNQIAYIGTGGLISMFVGPIIMQTFIEANLKTCFASMLTGFFFNVYLVLFAEVGWVEAPILSGIAGSLVYILVSFVTNGMRLKPAES